MKKLLLTALLLTSFGATAGECETYQTGKLSGTRTDSGGEVKTDEFRNGLSFKVCYETKTVSMAGWDEKYCILRAVNDDSVAIWCGNAINTTSRLDVLKIKKAPDSHGYREVEFMRVISGFGVLGIPDGVIHVTGKIL